MIRLERRRDARFMPKSFVQPKLTASARTLADLFYDAQASGRFAFDAKAWKPAKGALKIDTGGKCAYCEASTDVVAHGDVEHFRPKSVYWWLALAFDNYLFSCQLCNQVFKGDRFPIKGTPIAAPAMPAALPAGPALDQLIATLVLDATLIEDRDLSALWDAEDADLPHPYLEDPEPLFAYEPDDRNREMWLRSAGGDRADRAVKAGETVLGLNRPELLRLRYADYRPFFVLRATLGKLPAAEERIVLRELRVQQNRSQPFAGMKRFFARKWGLPGPL